MLRGSWLPGLQGRSLQQSLQTHAVQELVLVCCVSPPRHRRTKSGSPFFTPATWMIFPSLGVGHVQKNKRDEWCVTPVWQVAYCTKGPSLVDGPSLNGS